MSSSSKETSEAGASGDAAGEAKGIKRPAPDSTTEQQEEDLNVKSANAWEKANLGADDRKHKFLRLMGASKKDHHGRFVIGDKDKADDRTADDALTDNLESQYEQSLQHKLEGGWKGHLGLGFHKDDDDKPNEDGTEPAERDAQTDKDITSSKEVAEADKPTDYSLTVERSQAANGSCKTDDKPEDCVPDSSSKAPSAADKYKKMGFVKSS